MQTNPNLKNYSAVLAQKHGAVGSEKREKFNNDARNYFIGQIIYDARKEEHLTQEQLAKLIGANKSYISRIENGLIDPTISSIIKIVEALNLRIDIVRPM